MFFPLFFSNISLLMNYLGFATWLSIGAAVFCLPYLRWKCPDLPRPIKVKKIVDKKLK
jgi:solute carrier family 7 L-type amino acid transporter-like protein